MKDSPFSVIRSALDASVNLSRRCADGGMEEARFVMRDPSRFIVYLSSMSGCPMACRFCHLTRTRQVTDGLVPASGMEEQARAVLALPEAVKAAGGARGVHFNFMARGEPLSNPDVAAPLFARLADMARVRGLAPRMKVSTVMPAGVDDGRLASLCAPDGPPVDLYYSVYSMRPEWRRRWVPKAVDPRSALEMLARFRRDTGSRVILHHALVDGGNDSPDDAASIARAAREAGLDFDFNLVRYNPADGRSAEASRSAVDAYLAVMADEVAGKGRVREIPRVGFDVSASCGMFLSDAA